MRRSWQEYPLQHSTATTHTGKATFTIPTEGL
nr:MAG TPA: hypothetical protein [Caudoviricetes sp.]